MIGEDGDIEVEVEDEGGSRSASVVVRRCDCMGVR